MTVSPPPNKPARNKKRKQCRNSRHTTAVPLRIHAPIPTTLHTIPFLFAEAHAYPPMRESTPPQRRVTHSKRTTYRPCMLDVTKRTYSLASARIGIFSHAASNPQLLTQCGSPASTESIAMCPSFLHMSPLMTKASLASYFAHACSP